MNLLFIFWLCICHMPFVMAFGIVSTVVRHGDVAYYMHPLPARISQAAVPKFNSSKTAEPCTLLTIGPSFPELEQMQAKIRYFNDVDDVWSPEFFGCVIVQMTEASQTLKPIHETILHDLGALNVQSFNQPNQSLQQPEGPYFLSHGELHHAYRLYADTAGAFVVATVPTEEYTMSQHGFRTLDASAYHEQFPTALTVAVPSRLYFTKTEAKPYAGMRIAIKDIIDLKGLKTGASSRAFTELYPPKKKTAEAVQRLIDLGFVVVGKLKTTQFADSEWPTCDWVDYHGPFNPRGDGYLTPSGSSAGSASAISSYEWLDFSLGTDTLGSIRSPSAAQAIFGMRPTLGAVSTVGLVPYSPNWDTIGGFARTASEFKTLAQALYGTKETRNKIYKKPIKLLYPTDYWPAQDTASQQVFDKFITRVEKYLRVEREEINLAEIWNKTRPLGTEESISEYFHHAFDWSANRDQWTGLLKPFIDEYTDKMGKAPILNPQVRFKVGYTPTVTAEQKAQGEKLLKEYHEWFYKNVMPPSEDGYSKSIMVLPWTDGEPVYRDTYKDGPQQFTGQGFFFYNVGPYAQCPELIFPVGTTPYRSKYTGKIEQLPAAVGFITAQGSDIMLANLVNDIFEAEKSETIVETEQRVLWGDL